MCLGKAEGGIREPVGLCGDQEESKGHLLFLLSLDITSVGRVSYAFCLFLRPFACLCLRLFTFACFCLFLLAFVLPCVSSR